MSDPHTTAAPRRSPARLGRGFTLVEVLIAIAIVVILGGIVAVNVVGSREKSKVDVAKIQLDNVKSGLKLYYTAFGKYPTEDEGLEALWSKDVIEIEDEALVEQKWYQFLEKPVKKDPWDNEWQYTDQSEHGAQYDLWSYGPDGEDGTDDDIVSWEGLESDDGSGLGAPSTLPTPSGG